MPIRSKTFIRQRTVSGSESKQNLNERLSRSDQKQPNNQLKFLIHLR